MQLHEMITDEKDKVLFAKLLEATQHISIIINFMIVHSQLKFVFLILQ